ncbi:MAG: hypothetical protein NVS4B12_00530 [Ktedonobacteraceae bacterium]
MITEERLPPECAFAVSMLAERATDPDAVPEEAVETAQQYIATCSLGDGIEIVAKALGPLTSASQFSTEAEIVQRISQEDFAE